MICSFVFDRSLFMVVNLCITPKGASGTNRVKFCESNGVLYYIVLVINEVQVQLLSSGIVYISVGLACC